MLRFSEYNIIVTGGTGVLCQAIVKDLVEQGARVGILSRSLDKIQNLQKELGNATENTIALEADVLSKEHLLAAKKKFNDKFGKVDVLINGAGGNSPTATTEDEFYSKDSQKSFFNLDINSINHVFKLNFTGSLLPSQIFGEDILESDKGSILNISSMNAFIPLTKIPAYSGAKAAISNFTQWLATYFASEIRVNAIAPGFFETSQNKTLLRNEDGTYSRRAEKILDNTPMNRFGKPEDILGTVEWLIDENTSKFITGVIVPIDGGFSSYSGV